MRLQKFLAECGLGSRRRMESLIERGRVLVNGLVVNDPARNIDPSRDKVLVDRKPVRPIQKGLMIFNKPRGMVSTLEDPEGRLCIGDMLTKHFKSYFPVGRLDWDTTGLLILTNDGELAELLSHPRYGVERIYEAKVEGSVSENLLAKIRRGVKLYDGIAKAEVEIIESDNKSTRVEVKVREGRNRLVRRLFERVGHSVIKLKRVSFGEFKLGRLQVGRVRVFSDKEYLQIRRKVLGDSKDNRKTTKKIDS